MARLTSLARKLTHLVCDKGSLPGGLNTGRMRHQQAASLGKHIKIGSKEIMTIVSLLPFCIMVGERSKTEGLAGS